MKKIVSIFIVFVVLVSMLSTTVCAMSADDLANRLYQMGKPYGVTQTHKARLRNDLSAVKITDEKANQVIAKAQEIVNLMKEAGVTDYTDLSNEQKEKAKQIAQDGAAILGFTLVIRADGKTPVIQLYLGSKLIDELPYNPDTDEILLADTGSNSNIILVVSSVAVVALIAGIAVRKRISNA